MANYFDLLYSCLKIKTLIFAFVVIISTSTSETPSGSKYNLIIDLLWLAV